MSRLLAFRRFLLFTGRRVVVTTASVVHSGVGTHPPPPPSSLHTLCRPHSPDQHVGSPRGDAQEPSRPLHSMPAVSRIIEASDFQALRSSSAHVSIPRNDGGSHAEADRRGRRISTGSSSRRRDFFVLRATRIPGIAASLVPQDSTWKCSSGQMHSAYYCEQKRGFASGESNKALSVKDDIDEERISVTFVDRDGDEKVIQVPIDMSMLEAAHENDIELEGACEGSLACSTCHVIVMDEEYYEKIPEPSDEENDMLDLAFGLTEMSRLGCQVVAKPELDGMRLALPSATRNFAVDGHVPKPH